MVTTRGQNGITKARASDNIIVSPRRAVQSPTPKSPVKEATEPNSPVPRRRKDLSHAPHLGTHVLFLFVGAERELVTIHSSLLSDSAKDYIARRNNGEPLFQLPDEDITIARIYRLFLYTGSIFSFTNTDQDHPDNGRRNVHADAEWTRLAHCYLFGLSLKDEAFTNASIDAIIEKMVISDRYPTGIASEVYQFTPTGDNLRELLVDVHVWKGRGTWVKAPHDDATGPMEFLQDVIGGLGTAGPEIHEADAEMPWEEAPCAYYHVHEATGQCRR